MMRAVMSLSGGMDSTALLLKLLDEGYEVTCLTFDYGQKHHVEIERARMNIAYLSQNGIDVEHIVIDISSAFKTLKSSLTDTEQNVPEGHYESEQMRQTVVPNRNAIFSSIVFGHALSTSSTEDTDVIIALGVHSGDHEIYPDCRPDFYKSLGHAFSIGNWDSDRVSFHLPYIDGNKKSILLGAIGSVESLGLDFDTVLRNTNTSYNPDSRGRSSGRSGADVERILAFNELGKIDPLEYVDSWDVVLNNALNVAKSHEASA